MCVQEPCVYLLSPPSVVIGNNTFPGSFNKIWQRKWAGFGGLRDLLSSNSSKEVEEIKGEKQKQPILVEGAAPYNKDMTVYELLDGSYDEADTVAYSDNGWYKKMEWWEEAMADFEKKG